MVTVESLWQPEHEHSLRSGAAVESDGLVPDSACRSYARELGFDAVDTGTLASARTFAIGTPIFEGHWQRDEMKRLLDAAAERSLVGLAS
jgi:predicted dinucleotide-binding enzyme